MGLVSWTTSNPLCSANWAYSPGEGDQGAYGVELAEPVEEMMMIGVCLLEGVGGLPSRTMEVVVSVVTSLLSCSPRRSLIRISCCSMGAMILGGCCSSERSLFGTGGFTIWLIVIDRAGLLCRNMSMAATARRALPTPMEVPKMMSDAVSVMEVLVREPRKALS